MRSEGVLAKMNWDRVKKESQERRSGAEWIGTDGPGLEPRGESKRPKRPSPKPPLLIRPIVQGSTPGGMPGCVCKKAVGFVGLHRKSCPLRK
jgi:hypothetical protein